MDTVYWLIPVVMDTVYWLVPVVMDTVYWLIPVVMDTVYWLVPVVMDTVCWLIPVVMDTVYWLVPVVMDTVYWLVPVVMDTVYWLPGRSNYSNKTDRLTIDLYWHKNGSTSKVPLKSTCDSTFKSTRDHYSSASVLTVPQLTHRSTLIRHFQGTCEAVTAYFQKYPLGTCAHYSNAIVSVMKYSLVLHIVVLWLIPALQHSRTCQFILLQMMWYVDIL